MYPGTYVTWQMSFAEALWQLSPCPRGGFFLMLLSHPAAPARFTSLLQRVDVTKRTHGSIVSSYKGYFEASWLCAALQFRRFHGLPWAASTAVTIMFTISKPPPHTRLQSAAQTSSQLLAQTGDHLKLHGKGKGGLYSHLRLVFIYFRFYISCT